MSVIAGETVSRRITAEAVEGTKSAFVGVGVSIISLQTSGVAEIIISHKVSVETTTTKGYIGTGRASCWTLGAHSNSNIEVSRQRLTSGSGEVE